MMQFVDRKFLSMRSTDDVAAALPAGILAFTLFCVFSVTCGFTSAVVSQFNGRRDAAACARVPWAGFHLSLAAGLVCSFGLTALGCLVLDVGGHPPAIAGMERDYFLTLMPGGGFVCIVVSFCAYFSGLGKTMMVALVNFIGCALNAVLAYALIFGKLGAPELGISGAGLATTLATAVTAAIAAAVFLLQPQKKHPTRKAMGLNMGDLRRLVCFGAPNGFQVLCDVAAFTAFIFFIGTLGQAAMAATTIAMSINMISFMPQMGISEATAITVGRHIGAGRVWLAERSAYMAVKMSVCYIGPVALLYLFGSGVLIDLFSPAGGAGFEEVRTIGGSILACAAVYIFLDAIYFVMLGALRGAGDTSVPMWIVTVCAWFVLVPGAAAIVFVLKMSILSVWVFITAYAGLVAVLVLLRFQSGAWKRIRMIGPAE